MANHSARKELAARAVARVLELETAEGRQALALPEGTTVGVVSSPPRLIEVLVFAAEADVVELEGEQIDAALKDPNFWLYVVEHAAAPKAEQMQVTRLNGESLQALLATRTEYRYAEMDWPGAAVLAGAGAGVAGGVAGGVAADGSTAAAEGTPSDAPLATDQEGHDEQHDAPQQFSPEQPHDEHQAEQPFMEHATEESPMAHEEHHEPQQHEPQQHEPQPHEPQQHEQHDEFADAVEVDAEDVVVLSDADSPAQFVEEQPFGAAPEQEFVQHEQHQEEPQQEQRTRWFF